MKVQQAKQQGNRLFFLDNLKAFIIFLVVVYHAGWVYESNRILSAVWIVDDPVKNGLAPAVGLILDMFMMPVMFFISGYFTPRTVQLKSGASFLVSRFKRLMIPWILAVLVLIPVSKAIFLYSRGLGQESFATYFHFTGGIPMNQGWLWFLPVLFLFDMVYFLLSKLNRRGVRPGLKSGIAAVLVIGILYNVWISVSGLSGWTKTAIIDFQNERLLVYFMCFLLGALCYRNRVFARQPGSRIPYYVVCSTIWIPMNLYIVFLLNLLSNPGNFIISGIADVILLWTGFHLTMLGMIYLLVNTFRFYLNRSDSLSKALSDYSYGVYIIHFIIMGFVATILLQLDLPSLAKYGLLIIATFVLSNLAMFVYQSIKSLMPAGSRSVQGRGNLVVES